MKYNRIIIFKRIIVLLVFLIGFSVLQVQGSDDEEQFLDLFKKVYKKLRDEYVEKKDPKDLLLGAINGMIRTLDDPHTALLSPQQKEELSIETKGEYGGLGIVIGVRDNILTVISPMEDTPAEKAGILAGDKIIKIENEPVKDPILNEVVNKLRGTPGTKVTISVEREGLDELLDYTMTRQIIKLKAIKSTVIDNKIGYIKIISFNRNAPRELEKALRGMKKRKVKSLILDVRNNPGGLLDVAVNIVDLFISEGLIVYTRAREGVFNIFLNKDYYANKNTTMVSDDVSLAVLINHGSASASEIFAGAIQDHKKGVLVGVKSFGKGSVQSVINLDGYGLRYTTAYYYTPGGRLIHKKGIEPDIEVKPLILTKKEMANIEEIRKKGYIKQFLKEKTDYNDEDIKNLRKKLVSEDLDLDEPIIRGLVKNEKYRNKKAPIYDLDTDLQLKMAVQLVSLKAMK